MPNFESISFKMAVLQGAGQNLPSPRVCVIQKTPCGIGLRERGGGGLGGTVWFWVSRHPFKANTISQKLRIRGW